MSGRSPIRRLPTSAALAVAILACLALTASAEDRPVMTRADFETLVTELSNWGRWGKDDQLGALNLITPAKRLEAVKLVKEGVPVSLAHQVEKRAAPDNPFPFEHKMLANGREGDSAWAMDNYSVAYHGFAHTHMDALCHLFYDGTMYNGFKRQEVGPEGANKLAISNFRDGIMTRGILIDIPALRGERFLEPGAAIYPDELDAWEKHAGLKVGSGDVVFIRTGRWARRALAGPWDGSQEGLAGLHASCARWLKERDIAMLGSDAAADVIPSQIEGVESPIHVLTLHVMGVPIFDNCDLEAIAAAAAQRKRWEFLLTAAPLIVEGGTGSPLNPIATF